MIPKEYGVKIRNILDVFCDRVELLEKLQGVEKQLKKQFEDINEEQNEHSDETS